ncbi:MAG: hypothetical protein NVS4B12_06950 [Ktedonobacteraceae bacterium]
MKRNKNGQHRKLLLFSLCILIVLVMGASFLALKFSNEKAHAPTFHAQTSTPIHLPTIQGTVQPLFSDRFLDNRKGWSVVNVPGYMRTLLDNTLTLSDSNHNVLVESVPTSTTFTNFSLTTTFTLVHADENDSVGLYLRGDSNLDHDYRVDIFGNNTYAISSEALDASNELVQTFLVQPTHTALLNAIGQKNRLSVIMKGPAMVVKINGKTVHSLKDTMYTHGQIALFVENGPTSSGVIAQFHDLLICPVPNSQSQ